MTHPRDPRTTPSPTGWHLAAVIAAGIGYAYLFQYEPPGLLDEAWPVYAAWRLHEGGTLYEDILFIFPPGHVLAAWLGYALDPPGFGIARVVYAAFDVALAAVVYRLGLRLMPASFALLGALLTVFSAPAAHEAHLLFGHRYMVFSALALAAFARRLDATDARWLFVSGICIGAGLCFRITPAFAAGVGVGLGVLVSGQGRYRDWTWMSAGLLLSAGPVVLFAVSVVGGDTLWREVVERPVAMTIRQALPMPELTFPVTGERRDVEAFFVAVQFRAYSALYVAYAGVLAFGWIRAIRARRPFASPLLLAVVVWGGIYFARSLGRADGAHLASTLPPTCLLLAHLLWTSLAAARRRWGERHQLGSATTAIAWLAVLAGWVYLSGADRALAPVIRELWPHPPSRVAAPTFSEKRDAYRALEEQFRARHREAPRAVVLDLTATSLIYVSTGSMGPGYFDIVMPGTFLDEREERWFLAHLERSPPAGFVWPTRPFDGMPDRSLAVTAPSIARWVRARLKRQSAAPAAAASQKRSLFSQ